MTAKRIIARLDIKGDQLIKGIHLEGWRFLGNPNDFCVKYYNEGIDEIILVDAVASLYGRDKIKEMIKSISENVFVPITVGGGIRTLDDATEILRSGADKVAVNTAAVREPNLIKSISNRYGRQCMVVSIQAKKKNEDWYVAYDSAREYTNIKVIDWVVNATKLGAGEILLTSVDNEGTQKGFDTDLIKTISNLVDIPIISCGGFGKVEDFKQAIDHGADAVAIAHSLHYNKIQISEIRNYATLNNIDVRIL